MAIFCCTGSNPLLRQLHVGESGCGDVLQAIVERARLGLAFHDVVDQETADLIASDPFAVEFSSAPAAPKPSNAVANPKMTVTGTAFESMAVPLKNYQGECVSIKAKPGHAQLPKEWVLASQAGDLVRLSLIHISEPTRLRRTSYA